MPNICFSYLTDVPPDSQSTVYDRRACRSNVLKLRNLIVLTIRKAGTRTSASTGIAQAEKICSLWCAREEERAP